MWFEQIILGEMESHFDDLCQRINERLLTFLLKTWKDIQEGNDRTLLFLKVFEMLQTFTMGGLLSETTSQAERMGVVSLVFVLYYDEIERRQRNGLVVYA